MTVMFYRSILTSIFLFFIIPGISMGQNKLGAHISGRLSLDNSWDSVIYLSHIPTFDDLYVMSNEMILAETAIDSLGSFSFRIDFLPKEENLYRLHIVKKEDTPATLIIGGKDENHLFLIANCLSNIQLVNRSSFPPFAYVTYENSEENNAFQQISQMVSKADSIAAEGSSSKRLLVESRLNKNLLLMADTANNFLVSLYAIFNTKFESNYASNLDFYKSYVKRWRNQDNVYYNSFAKQLPIKDNTYAIVISIILAFVLSVLGFFLGKRGLKKSNNFEKLSIQERKVYEFLQDGATNQEISNHFNIGLSTVKSHVSSIYSKLNVSSRKDIVNMK